MKKNLKRKIVLVITLKLLLVSMLILIFNFQQAKATGTIYIRTDGSIDPPTANITRVGDFTYIFTDNNYDEIVVESSNIIIDGNGYELQGSGSGNGFNLTNVSNVTIQNGNITGFFYGIYFDSTSYSTFSGNEIRRSDGWGSHDAGIYLTGLSAYNMISGNKIAEKGNGIRLEGYGFGVYSHNNTVLSNEIESNYVNGIYIDASTDNSILGNNVSSNGFSFIEGNGIILYASSNNTIAGNNVRSNKNGIRVYGWASNNNITENDITENENGIVLDGDVTNTNNLFYHNNFVGNAVHVAIIGGGHPVNVWDNGSEGNYWDDYLEKYPNATEIDGTGIWDTPYVIDENNQDNYPIVPEFPSLLILPIFMMAALVAAILYIKERPQT